MNSYEALAPFYDLLNGSVDYEKWADRIAAVFSENGIEKGSIVLDAACGTGKMTVELAKRGYDMIGTDLSPEMLNEARNAAYDNDLEILYLLQDLTKLDLFGTVKAITCCLDSLNYLRDNKSLKTFFDLADNYIEPDGLLVFDMNAKAKFENVYGENCYVLEEENVFLTWQNFYSPKTRDCRFVLDIFEKKKSGAYQRLHEEQTEHYFPRKTVEKMLLESGFEILSVSGDFNGTPADEKTERLYYICRRL